MSWKRQIVLLLSLIALFGSGMTSLWQTEEWKAPESSDTLSNPLVKSGGQLKSAQKIFDDLCWTCHGLNGNGKGPAAATLPIKPADFSQPGVQNQPDGALFWKISTGRGNMASYKQVLTPTQRWQLVCYIRKFGGQANATIPANNEKP